MHLVERGPAALVNAVHIVEFARPVDADADEKVVLFEEGRPLVVQQRAVGLHGVQETHARPPIFLDHGHGAPEEIQPHQGWLAPLPGDVDAVRLVRLDELADVLLQHVVAHAELAAGIEDFLVQKKAVGAVEIADRAGGLGQQMKGRRRADRPV